MWMRCPSSAPANWTCVECANWQHNMLPSMIENRRRDRWRNEAREGYIKHPKTNIQIPEKLQRSSSKRSRTEVSCLELGVWSFSGIWMLGFGIYLKCAF